MISSKNAMIEIDKVLKDIYQIHSIISVSHIQATIEACIRCLDLAEFVLKNDPSYEVAMYYITIAENISKKLRNDCNLPLLADMIIKKCIMVGETIKKINK